MPTFRLAVGRIGDHIGPAIDCAFAVDSVTITDLLDPASRRSLIGRIVDVDHDNVRYGVITSVDDHLTNGILFCTATVYDKGLVQYLQDCKDQGIELETSPKFRYNVQLDRFGRRIQKDRMYESVSILTHNVMGRGGSDVKVEYSMGAIKMTDDALHAKVDAIMSYLRSSDSSPELTEDEKYENGFEAGMQAAEYSYNMRSLCKQKGVTFEPGSNLEEVLTKNLPSFGIAVEGKTVDYMMGVASNLSFMSTPTKEREKTNEGNSKPGSTKLMVKFGGKAEEKTN